jgi:hypothetical protein
MASPNSTFTELVSTTFRKHRKEIKDNLSKRNALLRRMMKRGNTRKEDGGLTIACPLDYAANSTYQRYSDWDILNIAQSDVISAAEYQWRQIALNVVASGRDLRINSGESRIVNLAKARMKNAIRTFNNSFSSDLYSDGTATNQINGLQALIANAGTGTVGGINSTNFSFWQNTVQSAAAPIQGGGAVTVSATTIENQMMLPLWLALDRGPDDQPDLVVMDNIYWQYFEGSQVSLKRYNDRRDAEAGIVSLKYKTADVEFDGNSGIPASTAYFINSNYLELVVHQDADLQEMDELRPVNQDGVVIPILWMGNLTLSNRKLQGVMKA